uniref:Secreted protein n=1 Tax=Pyrodinium bahamense TaxID=73915 RepID=A0A7S0ASH7_9DINO|mmetsp:Transcript_4130/g.11449  ORF Transcript_4130/g.11449 Transcript_4130/m.11449 type:complete len:186 (+) Transcript_4130:30-587(+)
MVVGIEQGIIYASPSCRAMGALPCLVATLALCMAGVDGRVGAKGFFSVYTDIFEERECSCSCCIRELRRPNEINGNAKYKCSMPPVNDKRVELHGCTSTCTVVNDAIFHTSGTLETNRFCFYHCQPRVGGTASAVRAAIASQQTSALYNGGSLVDTECMSVLPSMLDQAVLGDHNGRDAEAPLST